MITTLLGACSFLGKTKIEYERLVKALDERDMPTVMSAGKDGYASIYERGIYSTYEEKGDGEHSKNIYQTTEGIYNTKERDLYGSTVQSVVTYIENEKDPTSRESYKKEVISLV
ncbi:DUF3952 domain-containing protein [Bacillus manliponensis]